jgi:bacterioferritin
MTQQKKEEILRVLDKILIHELAGVVKYMHFSFMIFGPNRLPLVQWLRDQAKESLLHLEQVGELITSLGGHPSMDAGEMQESNQHGIKDILKESLVHEEKQLRNLEELLKLSTGYSIRLEEFARSLLLEEETHVSDVEKMLRGL